MKRWIMTIFALLPLHLVAGEEARGGGYGPAFLPEKRIAPVAESATDEQLRAHQGAARFGGIAPADQRTKTYDLAANSTFLQSGEWFTLVPKGAVLHVPEKLAAWVVKSPAGKFQSWPEFLLANRGQLTLLEVTLDQASGKEPLDPAKLAAAEKSGGLVVAVCKGGTVSVAPAGEVVKK